MRGDEVGRDGIRVARDADEVHALDEVWRTAAFTDSDADPELLLHVCRLTGARPHVVVVPREGRRPLVAVARVQPGGLRLRLGYRSLGQLPVRVLDLSFGGFLNCEHLEDARLLLRALLATSRGQVDVVQLPKTEVAGLVAQAVEREVPGWRRTTRRPVHRWFADLPGSWEELLQARGSKSRRQLRYDDNKTRKKFGEALVVRRLHDPEHLGRVPSDLDAVAVHTYQHALGASITSDPVQRGLLDLSLDQQWFRAWAVYVEERPVAFWWGIAVRGTLTIMSPGFVPEVASDRLGYFAFRRMLEDCCTDPGVSTIDFGPGDADYKERFGTRQELVADQVVFASGPRGWLANAVVRALDAADRLGRAVLARAHVWHELRTRLRRRRMRQDGGAAPAS